MTLGDEELVHASRAGSVAAFEALVRRHERMVQRIAYGLTRDGAAAMDVTQNTFLKVHAGIAGWRGESAVKTWIARIATHEALNWNRARQCRPELALELAETPRADPPQEQRLRERETLDALHRALSELSAQHRTALVLRYFLDLSAREIGAVLECNEGTARNVLFRGLRKLRSLLAATEESVT